MCVLSYLSADGIVWADSLGRIDDQSSFLARINWLDVFQPGDNNLMCLGLVPEVSDVPQNLLLLL